MSKKNNDDSEEEYEEIEEKITKTTKTTTSKKKKVQVEPKHNENDIKKEIIKDENINKPKKEIIKKEKKEIIKTNEGIIKIKMDINNKLNTRLIEIQTKINMNLEEISKQEKKIKSLEDKKEKERQEYLKEEEIQKKKYRKLKLKCDNAEDQILELENKLNKIDSDKGFMPVPFENYDMANDIIEKENKDIQLKEEEIKNQNLIEEIKELTNKISHFSFDDHSTKINTISNNTHKSPIVSSITKKKSLFSIIK